MNVSRRWAHQWVISALLTVTLTGTITSSSSVSAAVPTTLPPPGFQQQGDFVPLSWSALDPVTQYTLADGTLVTHVGGRTRDRHAREVPPVPKTGDPYDQFAAHYFYGEVDDLTLFWNVSPGT